MTTEPTSIFTRHTHKMLYDTWCRFTSRALAKETLAIDDYYRQKLRAQQRDAKPAQFGDAS